MRWNEVGDGEPGREVFCVSTMFRLKHYRDVFPFIKLSQRVTEQLNETPGLIRYALAARFFKRRFRTLSVWKDRESMLPFVSAEPHAEAVKRLDRWAATVSYVEWTSDDTHPGWEEAARRLENPTASYERSPK